MKGLNVGKEGNGWQIHQLSRKYFSWCSANFEGDCLAFQWVFNLRGRPGCRVWWGWEGGEERNSVKLNLQAFSSHWSVWTNHSSTYS